MNKKFNLIKITSYNNIEISTVIVENQGFANVMLQMYNMAKSDNCDLTHCVNLFGGKELAFHTTDVNIIYCVVEVDND